MKARGLAGTDSRVQKVGRGQAKCGRKRQIDQRETMSALAVGAVAGTRRGRCAQRCKVAVCAVAVRTTVVVARRP